MDTDKIQVKGLTRGQLRELRKQGITAGTIADMDEDKREDALDKLFKMACPDLNADELLPMEGMALYNRIIGLTYVTDEAKKNSESPQPSAVKEEIGTAASVENQGSEHSDTAPGLEEPDGSSPKNPFTK